MYTVSCKYNYPNMVFENVTPVYKKSPRDSLCVRASPAGQPRNFHGLQTHYTSVHVMNPSRTNTQTTLGTTMYRCVLRRST